MQPGYLPPQALRQELLTGYKQLQTLHAPKQKPVRHVQWHGKDSIFNFVKKEVLGDQERCI